MNKSSKHHETNTHHYRRKQVLLPFCLVAILLVAALAFELSPWPSAWLVRYSYNLGGKRQLEKLKVFDSANGIRVLKNQTYSKSDPDALLDVYRPIQAIRTSQKLPVIIWVHGGGWISGDKSYAAPYYKLLAAQGFVVVSVNYGLAPEHHYPAPLFELNQAYDYIENNAASLGIEPNKVILAGDSTGAQLASQMAAVITNTTYAKQIGISSRLSPSQVRAVVLYCGIYDLQSFMPSSPYSLKSSDYLSETSIWSYTGNRKPVSSLLRQMSPLDNVNDKYPPTFISGGNADDLTAVQSIPFGNKLESLGVDVTTLYYSQNQTPALNHEYQFDLSNNASKQALIKTAKYLKVVTK